MFDTPVPATEREILTVSRLNRLSRQILETQLPLIWVEGELSNVALPSSGHWYFTLKDDAAQVRCAMFKNRNQGVKFQPAQGQHVLLRARVSLYEGRGDYQLIAEHMEEAGFGKLQREFEQLKQRLGAEGLFAADHKRPLPTLPRHIAVITSPTGAAIRDILSVLGRRFAACEVTVIPALVQGKEAPRQLIDALALAARANCFDAVILSRGGGSLEDLWPFNDEALARAIWASELPVISAVGHEVDFTIADFVADVRAPTPSAAAELLVPDATDWLRQLAQKHQQLHQIIVRILREDRAQLDYLSKRLRHPREALHMKAQRLDGLEISLTRAMKSSLTQAKNQLQQQRLQLEHQHPERTLHELQRRFKTLAPMLERNIIQQLQQHQQRLGEKARLLHSVSPLDTLDRGYAIVRNGKGEVIRESQHTTPGSEITATLRQGELLCTVKAVRP
ncbi:MAG TPA: exodeoxyribonuclease VII large subunit [Cellvibrionaceae bacterium]